MPTFVLTLLVAFLAAGPQRPPDVQLNLVAAPPPPERPSDPAGRVLEGCIQATTEAPPTLRVTLLDTDRLSYTVGDSMSFNVLLENIGNGPLALGISRDPEIAPRGKCGVVPPASSFEVYLVAMRGHTQGAIIAQTDRFYGSLNAPGTTAVLQPGERARVQLPAWIRWGMMEPALSAERQPMRIKALAAIEREELSTAVSENTLQIELRDPVTRPSPSSARR
jgi:hypothetical protein